MYYFKKLKFFFFKGGGRGESKFDLKPNFEKRNSNLKKQKNTKNFFFFFFWEKPISAWTFKNRISKSQAKFDENEIRLTSLHRNY